jgi:hypothetical protein
MPNKFIRIGCELIVGCYIYFHVALVAYFCTPTIVELYSKTFFRNSYVRYINTSYYSKEDVLEVLQQFNDMGDGVIVRFGSKGRHIDIYENTDLGDRTLGQSLPMLPNRCKIYLKPGMDYSTFRETLIHEFLHCMGYVHEEYDEFDLMYPYLTKIWKEDNIKDYAQKLKRKFHYGE